MSRGSRVAATRPGRAPGGCPAGGRISINRAAARGRRGGVEVGLKPLDVVVEQRADRVRAGPRRRSGRHDALADAADDLGILVTRGVGPLLARQRQHDARLPSRGRGGRSAALSGDLRPGPLAPQVEPGCGFDDVDDVGAARAGGAYIVDVVEAATGVNLWREWARTEVAGEGGTYDLPQVREDQAGIVLSLARQEWPDTTAYQDPEIVSRIRRAHHAGLIVSSARPERIGALLDDYVERFRTDFHASAPPPERPLD